MAVATKVGDTYCVARRRVAAQFEIHNHPAGISVKRGVAATDNLNHGRDNGATAPADTGSQNVATGQITSSRAPKERIDCTPFRSVEFRR